MTPEDRIAQWMFNMVSIHGELIQSNAAKYTLENYGEEHLYKNDNGNWAINKSILNKFKVLRGTTDYVWATQLQLWRKRVDTDPADKTVVSY